MLKFKNKFKFGSSNTNGDKSTSPELSTVSSSPRNSVDSKRTISTNNLSDTMLKLSINGASQQGALPEEASSSSSSTASASPKKSDYNQQATTQSSHKDHPTLVSQPHSSTAHEVEQPNTTASHNPGLLTVKIYNSNKIQLPIQIDNNKQILHALAVNSNNESTTQYLLKNLGALESNESKGTDDQSGSSDHLLPGKLATSLLPSIITIPNAENLVKSLLYLTIEFDNNVLVIEPQKGTVNQSTWNQVVSFDVTKKSNTNQNIGSNFLILNLFIRLPSMLIPESEKLSKKHLFTNNTSPNANPNNIGDLLIGTIKLPLSLKYHVKPIRLMNHEYLKFTNYNLNASDLVSKELGEIMLTIEFKPISKAPLSIDDFDLLKVIGKGSFGKVMQVVKKDTKQIYALKTLRKQHIVSRNEVTHTLAERTVLARINNPFIVPLKFSFQSPEKLYLVLSFINGGELFWHLQREGKFSMDRSRFYIAELLTALESLHELNVIYRDLKPENILLDYQGHIALCDFGLCKLNMSSNDRTSTFCGTPEYLAPELILNQGYTRSVDWWTLGTLLYEMLTGLPPFFDEDTPTMYRKILQNPLRFPSFLESTDAQDLLIKLLQKDPKHRLNDATEIKSHPFFKDIDWVKLINKSYLPPFKPNVENLLDTSNFDSDFTNEKPQDSVVDDFLSESVQQQFGGWTYNGDTVFK
ncbi:putative serine/thronine protein kinase [Suhomyces tanzawaensis NRRL Y-17324]|uniref:non-specific serine/threonine protein kinase n=1 Tax=Suhomyces tanzawaensis NRRL Y-17324 TaxID=984487 RepID=A0A1E4SN92_9ASCO|nr:putative serine/thronine protein kinase [Suhomyces tanzawaensis NRRL Y-17324]ODV80966.1 putative serine/thronine protein kinase [Suhomyces tanzawaensis NRRL Y-17324]